MQKWMGLIIKVSMVAGSVCLAWFFSGRQFWLDTEIQNSRLHVTDASVRASQVNQPSKSQGLVANFHRDFNERQLSRRCDQPDLGAVKYTQVEGIYTWTDERGIKNYSDKKPVTGAELYQSEQPQRLDYFDLKLHATQLSPKFKSELTARLRAVFRAYSHLVGLDVMRKVQLNLHVVSSQRYKILVRELGRDPVKTNGVYFSDHNTGYIKYSTFDKTMRVAVHEAIHNINATLFGRLPRWLNEGLAEYFEYTRSNMQASIVPPNKDWLSKSGQLNHALMPLSALLQTKQRWDKNIYARWYSSSWAFVYFLASHDQYTAQLRRYLLAEQQNTCKVLDQSTVDDYFIAQMPSIEQNFIAYMAGKLTVHRY